MELAFDHSCKSRTDVLFACLSDFDFYGSIEMPKGLELNLWHLNI